MKKWSILACGLVGLVIIAGIVVLSTANRNQQIPSNSFPIIQGDNGEIIKLNAAVPSINDSYPVYRTVVPVVSTNYVEDFGKKFNMTGVADVAIDHGEFVLTDSTKNPKEQLTIFPQSGNVLWEIPDKKYITVTDKQLLPSDQDAIKIATKFLTERGLLPPNVQVQEVIVSQKQEEWKAGDTKPSKSIDTILDVRYSRQLDSMDIYGEGLAVNIGNKGEVVGYVDKMRTIDPIPYSYVHVISPTQAFNNLQNSQNRLVKIQAVYPEISINNISLGYYSQPMIEKQKYLTPVYVLTGTATKQDGTQDNYTQYINAGVPEDLSGLV